MAIRADGALTRLACAGLLAVAAVAGAQAPLHLDRRLVEGARYRLAWQERACDDPSGVVVRGLEASITLSEVDRRGQVHAVDVVVERATDPDPSVAAPGTTLHLERLPAATARRSHSDWGGPPPGEGGVTRSYLTLEVLAWLFLDRADASVGSRRARQAGDTWSHRGFERREGLPVRRYRLPGTGRIEAREELDGVPVTHVVLEGRAAARVPLWEGQYRSWAEGVAESVELWVPDDASRPCPRVRVRRERVVVGVTTETTRTASAWCDEIRVTMAP